MVSYTTSVSLSKLTKEISWVHKAIVADEASASWCRVDQKEMAHPHSSVERAQRSGTVRRQRRFPAANAARAAGKMTSSFQAAVVRPERRTGRW